MSFTKFMSKWHKIGSKPHAWHKQLILSRSETYDTLGTSYSVKVASLIISSLSKLLNMKKLVHFIDLQRMRHKDKTLKAYITPKEALDTALALLEGSWAHKSTAPSLKSTKIHQKEFRT